MSHSQITSITHTTRKLIRLTQHHRFIIAVFALITVIVFVSQSGGVGFWDKHHGWSSSHALAIMSRATPENFFVGHARTQISADNFVDYIYYDRYPFFFSAFVGALISLTDDLSVKVFLARQVMLAIFVLTMIVAYLLVKRLVGNRLLALSISLLAFSGYSLIYYRDMIHFDQPALLGMMLLLYTITIVKLDDKRRWRWLYAATIVAVSLGRGYASFAILGLWFLIEAVGLLFRRDLSLWRRLTAIIAHDATRVLVIGVTWGALMLGYNLVVEAAQREVPIQQTSIVESALSRLPFGYAEGRNTTTSDNPPPPWGDFAIMTADRMIRWFSPIKYDSSDTTINPATYPLVLLALALIAVYGVRQDAPRRSLVVLIAGSGIAWIFFMINLTAEHDYTTMYGLGFALIFYVAALSWLQRYRGAVIGALLLSLGLFVVSNYRVYAENIDNIRASNVYTEDYNRILHAIDGSKRRIYDTFPGHCAILHSKCYVLGFYLGDNYITGDLDTADYIVTSYVYYTSKSFLTPDDKEGLLLYDHSLTPDNTVAYIFATADAERRYLPDDVEPMYYFGDELSLQKWELRDSVVVKPCQRITLESWWQMEQQPQANYSMLLAMVNDKGDAVSSVNTNLTRVPTQVWVPDAYFLDARTLKVPCDAPPGEYPLVLSVFDPYTVMAAGSLPVTLPDGSPFNDYVYLTTLFIEG